MTKPPYQIPTMAEIRAVPLTGLKAVSTFSGCGGSCLGFRMAGFRVLWANEFIPAAAETYRANHPDTSLNTEDIRKVRPEDILEAIGLKAGELDVVEGSPPCSSFSTAGAREKHWGQSRKYSDTVQRTDDLFFEYVRLLRGLRPKVFVAENVSGLVKGVAKGYFLEILAGLKGCGYLVGCKVLDAQWLGVPQARQRTIFIGVREDLKKDPAFPKPLPYRYSLREALPWVTKAKYGPTWKRPDAPSPTVSAGLSYNPETSHQNLELVEVVLKGGTGAAFDQKGQSFNPDQPCPTVLGTKPNQFSVEELSMDRFAIAKEWDRLRPGESSAKYFNLVRPHPDQPCPTICASHGHPGIASVTHPIERRKLTIAELKRICAFPEDFILTGGYGQQWERLGRAVPPVMMFHIARTIRDEILT